ncbi:MAG: histidinol dehydrogenase [Fusobacteriaceae bacterium]
MQIYKYEKLLKDKSQLEKLCSRSAVLSEEILSAVNSVEAKILSDGDKALKEFTKKFDGADLENFLVSEKEFDVAEKLVDEKLKSAIKIAKENIEKFHRAQLQNFYEKKVETSTGVFCWKKFTPIEKVGLYIPSGSAPLFSTVLMLVIPAKISGSKEIYICTPPNKNGEVAPEILWTAKLLGVTKIFKVGGAQAIFALAHGTASIPKVDKIFGPGNSYVMAAKMKVSQKVAIDMPAGPSEVLIIADKNSDAKFVASDVLSQAEHGPDSQSVVVSDDRKKLDEILQEINIQLENLPRKNIAAQSIKNSFMIFTPNINSSFEFSNLYAPEHLILSLDEFQKYLELVKNAGSVFCGKYSSESFGDYASGTNHTLPTSGFAKSFSGISVESFGKWITFQEITKTGFENLSSTVEIMAEKEELFGHKNAVTLRRGEK